MECECRNGLLGMAIGLEMCVRIWRRRSFFAVAAAVLFVYCMRWMVVVLTWRIVWVGVCVSQVNCFVIAICVSSVALLLENKNAKRCSAGRCIRVGCIEDEVNI